MKISEAGLVAASQKFRKHQADRTKKLERERKMEKRRKRRQGLKEKRRKMENGLSTLCPSARHFFFSMALPSEIESCR
jgi:hypothetical protein